MNWILENWGQNEFNVKGLEWYFVLGANLGQGLVPNLEYHLTESKFQMTFEL